MVIYREKYIIFSNLMKQGILVNTQMHQELEEE